MRNIISAKHTIIANNSLHSIPPDVLYAMFLLFFAFALPGCHPPQQNTFFDGATLGQWEVTNFGGQSDVYVKDDSIFLEMGYDLTGITWTGPLERMNYEITLEAMRVSGNDFFCGLTFPVDSNCCSLILGGWGGEVCGLSSLNYYDASENETTQIISFEKGRWYHVRLRVTPGKIQAWLDDEKIIDVVTTGKIIEVRPEVDSSQPLGIATWRTTGAIRNITVHRLDL